MSPRALKLLPGGRRRGLVLIIVVWLIVMLSFIAYALAYDMRIGIRTTSEDKKSLQALGLARIGMAKAVADLRNDRFMGALAPKGQNDTFDDIWARTEDKTAVEIKDAAGESSWTVRVVDANRKLNINLLNPNNYEALVWLLDNVCKVDKEDAENIALCVVDYIDADNNPGIMKGARLTDDDSGGETEAYTEWAHSLSDWKAPEDYKFHPRNDAMLNIEELLEIPGMTRDILYGDPEETSRDPIDRLDDDKPSTALVDYVCAGRGGININTAGEEVIAAALYGANHGMQDADGMAAEIIQLRKSAMNTKDDGPEGIRDFSELLVAGLDAAQMEALRNAFRMDMRSSEFDIIARGEFRGYRRTIGASVNVEMETYTMDPDAPETIGKRDTQADGEATLDTNIKPDPAVRVKRQWEYN